MVRNDSIDPLTYTVRLNKYNPEPPADYGYQRLAGPDLSADFHALGCEFTSEAARFYLDGKLMHTISASVIQHGEQNLWATSIASHMGRLGRWMKARCRRQRIVITCQCSAKPLRQPLKTRHDTDPSHGAISKIFVARLLVGCELDGLYCSVMIPRPAGQARCS